MKKRIVRQVGYLQEKLLKSYHNNIAKPDGISGFCAMQMRSALFNDFTQRRMVTPYRRWSA